MSAYHIGVEGELLAGLDLPHGSASAGDATNIASQVIGGKVYKFRY
jgi:hypothetical protein